MIRVCALLLVTTTCSSPRGDKPAPPPVTATPGVIAHRGASKDAPENTIASVDLGFAQGADGVEIDVWVSVDGRVVVFHDKTTKRFGGPDVPVAEQTFAALRALDVGDGEKIPTLEDVLARVPAGRTLFIEIKSGPDTVPAIADVVDANDPAARGAKVAWQAFSLPVMRAVRARYPDAPAYWLRGASRDDDTRQIVPIETSVVAEAANARMTGVAIDYRGWSPALASAAAGAQLEMYVWTIDDPDAVRTARDRGAVWIETNLPAMAVEALRK